MIKYKSILLYEFERYPEKCCECPMFVRIPYQCHNKRGIEGGCRLGYMGDDDMRDFYGETLFAKCHIKNNSNVSIRKELSDAEN